MLIFEKENIDKSLMYVKDETCPTKLEASKFTSDAKVHGKNLKIDLEKHSSEKGVFEVLISDNKKAKESSFNLELQFNTTGRDSQLWATPLSDDMTQYFATIKKLGIPITGKYTVNKKEYECNEEDCLITLDFGRGAFNYGVAYWWGFF